MKRILILFIFAIMFVPLTYFVHNANTGLLSHKLYKIGLQYIPTQIRPRKSQINTDQIVGLQLYYPLFSIGAGGDLESSFLAIPETRALDETFRHFQLCLRPDVHFSDGSSISSEDVVRALYEVHEVQENLKQLLSIKVSSQNCINVSLRETDPMYFHKLTNVASTILKKSSAVEKFPIGWGPYKISSSDARKLALTANVGQVSGSFSELEFLLTDDPGDALRLGVDDYNFIYQKKIPTEIEKRSQKIARPIFKSYAFVVNNKNMGTRKLIAKCIDHAWWLKNLPMPLEPIPGFLPRGLAGSNVRFGEIQNNLSSQMCRVHLKGEIHFIAPNVSIAKLMELYLKTHSFPIHVSVEVLSGDQFAHVFFYREEYMGIIGFDTAVSSSESRPETSTFIESFFRPSRGERIITERLVLLQGLSLKASQTNNLTDKENIYSEAHRILLETGYTVPLGQLVQAHYYAKEISEIHWLDRNIGVPDYSAMRVR